VNDINTVTLVGRLTRDAELKYTTGGQAISQFSIANNQSQKKGDEWVDFANFFDCALWGKTAESLTPYLVKGKQICIMGRLKQDRWADQAGQNHSRVGINVSHVQLLGGNREGKPQADNFHDDIPI